LFNPWPTFNIADAGVTVGALLLLYDVIFHSQKVKQG
jgi:lipoprotein signal peptidase